MVAFCSNEYMANEMQFHELMDETQKGFSFRSVVYSLIELSLIFFCRQRYWSVVVATQISRLLLITLQASVIPRLPPCLPGLSQYHPLCTRGTPIFISHIEINHTEC